MDPGGRREFDLLDAAPGTLPVDELGLGQLPVGHWHEALGEPTVADAILDRLVHGAYRLELRGASMRRAQVTDGPRTADEGPSPPSGTKPTATDGPGRPRSVRVDTGHPSKEPSSADSAAMPDYPVSDERR